MADAAESPRLAALAYRIWEQEGRPDGRAAEHWQRAEMLLEVEFRIGFPDATQDENSSDRLSRVSE